MNESAWVLSTLPELREALRSVDAALEIDASQKLRYSNEIRGYSPSGEVAPNPVSYETDLLIRERTADGGWIPRVIVEAKVNSINTHDAITYSQKAAAHKTVHPYLRYGIVIGNRGAKALPGRLFRHGAQFDFMMVFRAHAPPPDEARTLAELLVSEVSMSRKLEAIVFDTRSRSRSRYTVMQKPLLLS